MKWIVKCLKHYATFSGRAGWHEFWTFLAFCIVVQLSGLALDLSMGWTFDNVVPWMAFYPTFEVTRLLLVLPLMAVTCRRLHDAGEPGGITLLWFIPIVGWGILFYLLWQPAAPSENSLGPETDEATRTSTLPSST